jgi:hypothetical protein
MTKPELFDVIELLRNQPEKILQAGAQGAIVDVYPDGQYEVEFSNESGETLALVTLFADQFIVVWRAETKTWVTIAEKIEALVAGLPEDIREEVFDFARFIYSRKPTVPHS